MRKKLPVVLAAFALSLLAFSQTGAAGITASEASVELGAREEVRMCHLMVWTGIEGTTRHTVRYSDDLQEYVSDVDPEEFDINSYKEKCPTDEYEGDDLRDCITQLCEDGEDEYCRLVCTDFKGPFRLEFSPEEKEVSGSVRNVVEHEGTTTTNTMPFTVKYTAYPAEYVLVLVVILILLATLGYWYFRK